VGIVLGGEFREFDDNSEDHGGLHGSNLDRLQSPLKYLTVDQHMFSFPEMSTPSALRIISVMSGVSDAWSISRPSKNFLPICLPPLKN